MNLSFVIWSSSHIIIPGKGAECHLIGPALQGRRGKADGLIIVLKSLGLPYVRDVCHSTMEILLASPGEEDGVRSPELIHKPRGL